MFRAFGLLLILGNTVLIALALRPFGIGPEEMKHWGLTVVFVGVALTIIEDAAWQLYFQKIAGDERRRTLRGAWIGAGFCLLVAFSSGIYAKYG